MRLDAPVDRQQRGRARTYLVDQRRQAQRHAFAGVALRLTMQRLMLAEFLEQQHGEEVGTRPAARGDVERCRRLGDHLAIPAGEFLTHALDHLPLAWHHFQRLRNVLAQLRQTRAATGRAGAGGGLDHALARQMRGQRLA
jgi:hypothetical protein